MSAKTATLRTGRWKNLPTVEELRSGQLPPIVLFTGRGKAEEFEEYLMEEAFQLFWDHVTDEATADFNRDLFYADETRSEELFAQAGSYPMMADRRLVVLRRCEKAPAALLNDLQIYLEHPSPTTCLLLVATHLDKRRKVWIRVLKDAAVFEFAPLKQEQLVSWLVQACGKLGRRLSPPLAWRLAEQLAAAPLRMAHHEVEKLCLLAGDGEDISEADLATALGMEADATSFNLVDAVLAGRLDRALAVLQSLMRDPDIAFMLTGLLGKSLGRLWFMGQLLGRGVPADELGRRLGMNEWAMRKSLPHVREWPPVRVEAAMRLLLEADLGLKGDSPLSPSLVCFQLVVRLCRLP